MRRESNKPLVYGTLFLVSDAGKIVLLQDFMGRAIRVDRGRRFVQKPGDGNSKSVVDAPSELSVNGAEAQEPAEETPNSEDTPELSVNGAEADKAD